MHEIPSLQNQKTLTLDSPNGSVYLLQMFRSKKALPIGKCFSVELEFCGVTFFERRRY